jgi:CRP-like cAMP-binding protein
MDRERIRLLKSMPIFGGVEEAVLASLLEGASQVERAAGEFFFREGDPGGSALVLERGRVAVLKTWKDEDHLLRELGPGDCFGEVALMDFRPRSASVRAEEESSALELSGELLRQLYSRDLEQYALIHLNMGRELARRLRVANEALFRSKAEVVPVVVIDSFPA